jgi:hypothetical protein
VRACVHTYTRRAIKCERLFVFCCHHTILILNTSLTLFVLHPTHTHTNNFRQLHRNRTNNNSKATVESSSTQRACQVIGQRLVSELRDDGAHKTGRSNRSRRTLGAKFQQIGECLRDYHASNFGVMDSLEVDLLLRGVGIELVSEELDTLCKGIRAMTDTDKSQEGLLDARRFAKLIGLNYNNWVSTAVGFAVVLSFRSPVRPSDALR